MDAKIRRFLNADAPCGPHSRELVVGETCLRFEGLSAEQVEGIEHFWGPFLAPSSGRPVHATAKVCRGGRGVWLAEPSPDEVYRVEPRRAPNGFVALSYAFAFGPDDSGALRVALAEGAQEPAPQSLENVARLWVARSAAEWGGFAMHSAGVVREGKAWIFAGASGAGKTTAVRLSAPAESLGDDFGVVLPAAGGGWVAPPLPFDNAAVSRRPEGSLYPVAGIWKLFQGPQVRVERPPGMVAMSSLASCMAFPSAMPDLSGRILDQVGRFCKESVFGHLTFAPEASFWEPLRASVEALD